MRNSRLPTRSIVLFVIRDAEPLISQETSRTPFADHGRGAAGVGAAAISPVCRNDHCSNHFRSSVFARPNSRVQIPGAEMSIDARMPEVLPASTSSPNQARRATEETCPARFTTPKTDAHDNSVLNCYPSCVHLLFKGERRWSARHFLQHL